MTTPVIPCADVLRPISIGQLALSLELLEERLTEIQRLVFSGQLGELRIARATARAEVNVEQIRRHIAELGIVLPETTEPE